MQWILSHGHSYTHALGCKKRICDNDNADDDGETNKILRLASARILEYAYRHPPEDLPRKKTLWTLFDTHVQLDGTHTNKPVHYQDTKVMMVIRVVVLVHGVKLEQGTKILTLICATVM